MAVIDGGAGEPARGVEQIGGCGHAAEALLDRFEAADRNVELLADAGIGAGGVSGERTRRRRQRRQRDAAACGQCAHQHLPALADLLDAADHMVHGDENVVTPGRTVLERQQRGQMPAADLHARQVGRHQRHRDADLVTVPDQVLGIVKLERQTEHGGDRPERNVALVPVELDAEDLAALPAAAANDTAVEHGGGIRARFRTGEPEAGDLLGCRKPRQPVVLLRLGPEQMQQLAGTERVRHHCGHRAGDGTGGQLADHLRMAVGGEPETAVALRNDHGEELVALEIVPRLGRKIAQLPVDAPIVEHAAELLDRTIEEHLLFCSQDRRRGRPGALPNRDCRRTARHPTRRRRLRSPRARYRRELAARAAPTGRSAS